ncbi:MAG TPA: TetR/AcrR family transcriptional regulator [Planktothrix sp.]|jgi:AcrR family transcriptional regulator
MPVESPKNKTSAGTRDAEATKARILDAAEEEFARAGLLGARTEAIAANTGVTKAMLYYYYGDKEGLYQAVLERCMARRIASLQKVDFHGAEPEEALRQFVTAVLDEQGRNQHLPAIFFYEGLQNKGKYYSQIGIASLYGPLQSIIERGMASGKFKPVDALHASVNIIGICAFYYCSMENVKHLWPGGTDLSSDEMREQHKRTAIQQIFGGLLA